MKIASVKEVKDGLSRFLKRAEKEDIVITRNGHPTAILHSFEDEEEFEDYLLEHDPRFIQKIEKRWKSYIREGGVRLDEVEKVLEK